MRKSLLGIVLAALVINVAASPQPPAAKKTAASQQPKEIFWERVLRFSGISANPNTLKGADNELRSGQVWMADLATGTRRRITPHDGYRSPVYFPNGADILTLQGAYVVRISSGGDKPAKLYTMAGITKLVGFGLDARAEVLTLKEDDAGHVSVTRLSVNTGKITPLPHDPQSSRDRQMIEHLQDWQRSYGDTTVFVKRESRQTFSGSVDVFNVFVKTLGGDPQDVSHCDLTSCGQPCSRQMAVACCS